ncbi:putative halogenase [Phlebiopsis gigantea 11061_1 CR5-6]|uniref:Putative halogenase n=1 Tax=Phlebiopsis gigantea (strain 11061_1 CR5-6) TaxID=745531 RepID=A0A0C3S8X2_PHLG1|nr:putative halogenase [Phlebiopsis gigantea 11061_1 CR5-6]
MSPHSVPSSAQILVVGGGPAGSYSAAVLAREGFSVVLLEAAKFPRYHIGESLLPSVREYLQFIDAEELVANHGFCRKPGAAVKLNQYKREGYTDFARDYNSTWNVVRAEFDDLLLAHAATCGATVVQETRVSEIHFDGARPVAASWAAQDGSAGRIAFEYLVDASGRNGLMSVKYLKNRQFSQSLKNVALWGYWTGAGAYMPGTSRDNAVWIEALEDESGWAWFIPLHNGVVSVGVVMDKDISSEKRKRYTSGGDHTERLRRFYLDELRRAPGLMDLLGGGQLRELEGEAAVKTTSDFSYAARDYAGDHFRIAGDAGAFIDPFFSSGVHLALTGALSASLTIAASIRGTVSEEKAARWHDSKVGTAYTRFLIVVLGTYKQMRNQNLAIMSDIDEDNFDRAFDLLRPVINGSADVGRAMTPRELEDTMDFCRHLFAPTDPEMYASVGARIDPKLMSPSEPILSERDVRAAVGREDVEARTVLAEVNARKAVHHMYRPKQNFVHEVHHGLGAIVERGMLGLAAA